MRLLFVPTAIAFGIMAAAPMAAPAQAPGPRPEPLYDPTQLPAFHGRVQLFTLTPAGEIDGFVFDDDTEVKLPPHLTEELRHAVKPGDEVTVHGLKAASLPLVQAMSVSNDATGSRVVDSGPPPGRMPPRLAGSAAVPVLIHGRVRMLLHGPRGDVNGALLEDGTELSLPPPEATRLSGFLAKGKTVAARGLRRTAPAGSLVDLQALGPENGPLHAVTGAPRIDLPASAPAPD